MTGQYVRKVFVGHYRKPKNLTLEILRPLADERIYTTRQALDCGLIDWIGYLDEAIELAKQEAGLTTARAIIYHRPGAYKNNMYSQLSNSGFGTINLLNIDLKTYVRSGTPSFMYLLCICGHRKLIF